MDKKKINYKNILKRFYPQWIKDIFVMDSSKNWRTVLIIFATLLLFFIIWETWIFVRINNGYFITSEISEVRNTNTINRSRLKESLEVLEERKESFESLRQNFPYIVDPSL